jgi:hypothetical protein
MSRAGQLSSGFEGFDDLKDPSEDFFPGSKRPKVEEDKRLHSLNKDPKSPKPIPVNDKNPLPWDAHPLRKTVRVKGGTPVTLELFSIGALAKALGKSPITIRTWMKKGWLPRARFRTQGAPTAIGQGARQLWTRAEIEAILRIATEEKILEWHPDIKASHFSERVLEFFKSEVIG